MFWTIKKERQHAKTDAEKDFCKLRNNAIFGVDYRNNMNNWVFEPIISEVKEVSYNLLDKKISIFVNSELLGKKIEQKIANIKDDDAFKKSRITTINNEKAGEVEALEALKRKWKKKKKKIKKGKEQDVSEKSEE